jgi:hypothetical protein
VGSALAGINHFNNDLGPAFTLYIDMLVQNDAATCDTLDLSNQISALKMEHETFLVCAVLPGFSVESTRGQLSPVGAAIAAQVVPWGARTLRNNLVDQAINQFYYPKCGIPIDLPSKRKLGRRGMIGNASTPTTTQIQSMATFLNLTVP